MRQVIGSQTDILSAASLISAGTWYHLLGVRNGSATYLYLNGSLVASGSGSMWGLGNSSSWLIGTHANSGLNRLVDGLMDEVRIDNRALSADEVKRLYNMGR